MGGVGVSFVSTLWERREALHHTRFAEHITPYSTTLHETAAHLSQLGVSDIQTAGIINNTITQQGFIIGSNEIFMAGSLLFIIMIPVIWLAKPPFHNNGGGGH